MAFTAAAYTRKHPAIERATELQADAPTGANGELYIYHVEYDYWKDPHNWRVIRNVVGIDPVPRRDEVAAPYADCVFVAARTNVKPLPWRPMHREPVPVEVHELVREEWAA